MGTATEVKERPILFSGEMVRAILDGRKTQTRRVVKRPPWAKGRDIEIDEYGLACAFDGSQETHAWLNCPFADIKVDWTKDGAGPHYAAGSHLWVRETFCPLERNHWIGDQRFAYRASCGSDGDRCRQDYIDCGYPYQWKPSIHMPRWASRITLEVTDVRVERVREITESDAISEGFDSIDNPDFDPDDPCDDPQFSHVAAFAELWDNLNAKRGYSWESNPWVWVVSFRQCNN